MWVDDAGGEELVGGEDGVLSGALEGGVSGLGVDERGGLTGGPGECGGGELLGHVNKYTITVFIGLFVASCGCFGRVCRFGA